MSAIAGVFCRGDAPVAPEVLERISAGLGQMGPDGEHFAYAGSVGMVHRPFHTDSRSRRVRQPLATPDGFLLAFDGRIDNRAEVGGALDLPREDLPDAALLLAAYRRWGVDGFARLVGDFAFSLRDPRADLVLLCADSFGRRPLYYHVTPERVCWSSLSRALKDGLGLPPALDEEFVADFLMNRTSARSPFREIGIVPGGHVLVVDRGGAELKRYWSPDPGREIRYRSDQDYESHFLELFTEAVACRLSADGPVFSELSGGLDSSSIVCVADRLVRERRVEAPDLRMISYVFNGSASSDERPYMRLVEERVGRRSVQIAEDRFPILQPLPEAFAPDFPTNDISFLSRVDFVAREMRQAGSRVLLNGVGGDQLFVSQPPPAMPLADLLAQGKMIQLFRDCGVWSEQLKWPFLRTLWLGGCEPLLPRRLREMTQRSNPVGEWLDAGFVARAGIRDRALGMADDLGFPLPSSSLQYGWIRQTFRTFALEWVSSEGYVDIRYPYLDRRLVEFGLAIPLEQKVRPGESRSVVRRGLRGVLPDEVRQRRSKAGPTEAVQRAIVREWSWISGLLADARVCEHGFVDRQGLATALAGARHGVVSNPSLLLRTLTLELWLRTLEGRRPAETGGNPGPSGRPQTLSPGEDHARAAAAVGASR